jgi:hypothetical protein
MKFQKVSNSAKVKTYYFKIFDEELTQIAATLFYNEHVQSQSGQFREIKYYRNRQVYQFKLGNEIYYIKKFVSPLLINKIKNAIRLSKAVGSLRISKKLLEHNFEVAEPMAALTYQKNLFHKESIYITKNYSGSNLKEFLLSDAPIEAKKKALLDFSTLLGNFYKCGYYHSDPNLRNFIVKETNGKYRFAFIDLEAIHYYPWVLDICTFKSLRKLYKSIHKVHFDERLWNRVELSMLKNFLSVYKPMADFSKILRRFKL